MRLAQSAIRANLGCVVLRMSGVGVKTCNKSECFVPGPVDGRVERVERLRLGWKGGVLSDHGDPAPDPDRDPDHMVCLSQPRSHISITGRETEPDWDLEIGADTKEECAKFGQVAHLHVDRNSKASST